jgi:biotin synthase
MKMDHHNVNDILKKDEFSKQDLVSLLSLYNSDARYLIFKKSKEIKEKYVGNKVYLRGLIEYSNLCSKNCLYCGIRSYNKNVCRYTLSDEDVLKCAKYASDNNYASIVIQSGELKAEDFIGRITNLLENIKKTYRQFSESDIVLWGTIL